MNESELTPTTGVIWCPVCGTPERPYDGNLHMGATPPEYRCSGELRRAVYVHAPASRRALTILDTPGQHARVLVAESVYEDTTLTFDGATLYVEFEAEDLDDLAIDLRPLSGGSPS